MIKTYLECPCCGEKINAIKTLKLDNGCKSLKEKKCFYCPSCDRKIGKEHSVKLSFILQMGFILGVLYFVNLLGTYFNIPFYIYPFLFVLFFYAPLVVFINIYPLKCYDSESVEVPREVFEEFYSPVENVRMDDFEQNTMKIISTIPGIFIVIAFVVLVSIVVKSFF